MEDALVTGGSRGIGKAIAVRLSKDGFPIVINYNHSDIAAQQTKEEIEAAGGTVELLKFDISKGEEIEEALALWEERHPKDYISVLVNNAGIRRDNILVFMQNEEWRNVIETPLNGFFFVTRRLMKNMLTHRRGRVINIASLSGIKGLPGQTNYSAAKAAIIGATKALAQEVAVRKITVNAVAPGFIETDMTKEIDQNEMKKLIPAGRFGKPEEEASLVGFLASEASSYITGEVISINGGLYT